MRPAVLKNSNVYLQDFWWWSCLCEVLPAKVFVANAQSNVHNSANTTRTHKRAVSKRKKMLCRCLDACIIRMTSLHTRSFLPLTNSAPRTKGDRNVVGRNNTLKINGHGHLNVAHLTHEQHLLLKLTTTPWDALATTLCHRFCFHSKYRYLRWYANGPLLGCFSTNSLWLPLKPTSLITSIKTQQER